MCGSWSDGGCGGGEWEVGRADDSCAVNRSRYRLTAPDGTAYNGAIEYGEGKAWTQRSTTDNLCSTGTRKFEISSSTTILSDGKPSVDTSQSQSFEVPVCD
ncbi:hypothetical protein ACFQ6N_08835 [Kitasatospora sp. NPDC056446]|uniref:hypothetical protein n=1 Tax=Kitasatospora sp. NPDC056446 TaxID=3345819 RepID=UPI0036B1B2D2